MNDKIAAEREELASAAASDSLNTYSAASASPGAQPAPQASRQAAPQASRKAAPQATRQAAPQPSLAAYEAQRAGRSRQRKEIELSSFLSLEVQMWKTWHFDSVSA